MWSSVLALIISTSQAGQFAPPDVPKTHWAYPAVNELFRNGLLDGYPAQSPALRLMEIPFDETYADKVYAQWKAQGLLVGFPDGLHSRRPASPYEQAVAAFAAVVNLGDTIRRGDLCDSAWRRQALDTLPSIVKVMSMTRGELVHMGADVNEMLHELQRYQTVLGGRFGG